MAKDSQKIMAGPALDDVIKFSLPALVAFASENLFQLEADRKCCHQFFDDLMKQLQLDSSTQKSVEAFLKRNTGSLVIEMKKNPHIDPLVDAIRNQIWLKKSCSEGDEGNHSSSTKDEDVEEEVEDGEEVESVGNSKSYVSPSQSSSNSEALSAEPPKPVPLKQTSQSPLNCELKEDIAIAIISSLVVTALIRGRYDARVRIVIRYIVYKLRLKWEMVEDVEDSLVEHFREAKITQTEEEKKQTERTRKIAKIKRIAAISAATVIGGVAIGVTGGLAAPAIIGAMGGAVAAGGFGVFMASTAGAAVFGTLFGAVGAGLSGYKMNRRVGDVEEFEFVPLTDGQQLHLAVALPGWLSSEQPDCRNAYYTLSVAREQYCLKFESKYLLELGNALDYFLNIATSSATTNLAQEIAKSGASGSLQLLIAWPSLLLSAANVIDNPWSVCLRRSAKAGEHLAEVLLKRQQGHRPVTLIGFSLGARAIFYCLREMSRDKYLSQAGGIIQNVILLGTPVSASPKDWSQFSRVVAGEIVNGYSRTDWLLKFLYRTTSANARIAGLGPVEWDDRRMFNIDLSHIISGHGDYLHKMDLVLSELGIGDRRKATLMSLADSRVHMAASSSNASLPNRPMPKQTSSYAIEQLQLAEKIMSEDSLNEMHYKEDESQTESAQMAETLIDDAEQKPPKD